MLRGGDKERGQMPRPRDRNSRVHVGDRFFDKPNIVHLVAVKNQDILNDDESHFKLTRFVLQIASFEFANLHFHEFKLC